MSQDFWGGKRVFVTGHTGFKGGWLTLWLHRLGSQVSGYSLDPNTQPNFYTTAGVGKGIRSTIADVRQLERLQSEMLDERPEVAFHFAAQPLVRASYTDPVNTYSTNIMGTVHFLEAVRNTPSVRAAIVVTSDKCYDNRNSVSAHSEGDPMGGTNPYGSSKACAEIITEAYQCSYFNNSDVAVASVRAGNVMGGGDWAHDRLIPDAISAFSNGKVLRLRYADAVRPWQHVLDPLNGYLKLAEQLWQDSQGYAKGWNFGPLGGRQWKVIDIVRALAEVWGSGAKWTVEADNQMQEDKHLTIDASAAYRQLKWHQKLDIKTALQWTVEWYRSHLDHHLDMRQYSLKQIEHFESIH